MQNIYALYFSPTGGTKKIIITMAESLAEELHASIKEINYTDQNTRRKSFTFSKNDLLILGLPTYAGRIPNKILPDLEAGIQGDGKTPAIPISVYGNRNYDESLREMIFLLEQNGFLPVTAASCPILKGKACHKPGKMLQMRHLCRRMSHGKRQP